MSSSVQINTDIPGPKSQRLLESWQRHVASALPRTTPIFVESASGAAVRDIDGNTFIDFAGGIAVLNVGSAHPEVVAAVQEQAASFMHTCVHVTLYENYLRVAEELARITPGTFDKRSLLLNSGAEAVENAVKVARNATGRPAIVAMRNAFHGRTLMTMTLTGKAHPYREGFGPLAPEVYRAPFPYWYRMQQYHDEAACAAGCIEEMERLIDIEIGQEKVAAVIAEPIQGEGGFIVPPDRYLPKLAEVCRKRGIVLILDEIQTGMARTGKMFAAENWGVEPDIIVSAKSLGGGLPISAITGRAEIMDAVQPGGLGGTFTGNPVSCAAALKVIEIMERDDFPARARAIGKKVRARFDDMQTRYPIIGDVRGIGAMQAMELVSDRKTRAPAATAAGQIVETAYRSGLIILKTGAYGNVLRFLAPLVVTDAQLEEGLDILESAVKTAQEAG